MISTTAATGVSRKYVYLSLRVTFAKYDQILEVKRIVLEVFICYVLSSGDDWMMKLTIFHYKVTVALRPYGY